MTSPVKYCQILQYIKGKNTCALYSFTQKNLRLGISKQVYTRMTLQITFHKIKYFGRALNSNPFLLLQTKIFHIVHGDFSDCLILSCIKRKNHCVHNSTQMRLGLNSFKTIAAKGNFLPEITHRQTEGNVTLLVLKLRVIFGHFSEARLTQCTKEKYTFLVQQSVCIACLKLKRKQVPSVMYLPM